MTQRESDEALVARLAEPWTLHEAYGMALFQAAGGTDRRSYNLWRRVAARYVAMTGGPLVLLLPDGNPL